MSRVNERAFRLEADGPIFSRYQYVTADELDVVLAPSHFWPVQSWLKRLDRISGYARADSGRPVPFDLVVLRIIVPEARVVVAEVEAFMELPESGGTG